MFRSRITAGVLIVVSVLINSDETVCQPQPEQLLETLTTIQTSVGKTVLDLEQRCIMYERIIRDFLPADQQATASDNELYAHVMSQAERKQSLNAQEERVVGDIRECIALNSNSMTGTASVATPASTSAAHTGTHGYQQQARPQPPMFNQKDLFILSKLNYESREEDKAKRCKLFDETLRSIYNRSRPELVGASTPIVFQAAIEGLESRNLLALILLKECAQNPQASQAASSSDSASKQQQVLSELAQLRQAQEQFIKQHTSNSELVRRLESDLARETSRAMAKEREIDEFQREVARKAGRQALKTLRSKFESLKQEISGLLTDYLNVMHDINTKRREFVELIYKRVDEFKKVMEIQWTKASDKMDALQAKQEQENQQCVAMKEGFSKLESELEKVKQSLAAMFVGFGQLTDDYRARMFYRPLERFHGMLRAQLDTAFEIFADDTKLAQESQQPQSETDKNQTQTQSQHLDIYSKLAWLEKTLKQSMEQHASDRELLRRLENDFKNAVRLSVTSQNQEQLELQHLNMLSELDQLRQAHERLVKQQSSDSETLRRLESNLARETSRAMGKEREIDEFQRNIIREAGKEALSEVRDKFDILKRDITRSMTDFSKINDKNSDYMDRATQRSDQQNMINKQVDEFQSLMRGKLAKALSNIDALRGKQEQEDQQYVTIKEGFSKLESELEKFKRSLIQPFVITETSSRNDLAQLTNAGLEGFYETLRRQLDAALEYIGN